MRSTIISTSRPASKFTPIRTTCCAYSRISPATPLRSCSPRAPPDGRPRAIRFAAIRTEGVALIEISDTGPGFPADHSERIFEPFHKSTSEAGAGLGLAIAADLVARNGGAITLAPAKADDFYCGARFLITLPTPERAVRKTSPALPQA